MSQGTVEKGKAWIIVCIVVMEGTRKKNLFRTSKSIVVPKKLLVLGFVLLHSEQRTKQRAHAQKARGRIHTLTAAQERGPKRKHFQVANTNLACRAPRSDHTRGLFTANGFIYQRQRFDMETVYAFSSQ